MNKIVEETTEVCGLNDLQILTAASTLTRALATATREYLGRDAEGVKFETRHGEEILLIGSRAVLIRNGVRLKPMSPKRFLEHFQKHYGITSPTAKSDRARLEKAGLITEIGDPGDGRGVNLTLTEEGWAVFEGFATTLACICSEVSDLLQLRGPMPANPKAYTEDFVRDFAKAISTNLDATTEQ